MGPGEASTPTRSSKPASSTQEVAITPATPTYPDWSSSMQAFYGTGATPSPFFASTVAAHTPHPYIWGSQAPGVVHATAELDGKTTDGKDRVPNKKTMPPSGNRGMIGGNTRVCGITASGSANDVGTQSVESGSEDSSDASDDNHNQASSRAKKGSYDQMLAEGANAQSNGATTNIQSSIHGNPVVSVPATNLNIGIDLWNGPPAGSGEMKLQRNPPGVSSRVGPSGMMNDQWVQC